MTAATGGRSLGETIREAAQSVSGTPAGGSHAGRVPAAGTRTRAHARGASRLEVIFARPLKALAPRARRRLGDRCELATQQLDAGQLSMAVLTAGQGIASEIKHLAGIDPVKAREAAEQSVPKLLQLAIEIARYGFTADPEEVG